tara:strand:- start:2399 stop:2974 length:576 start_codon:yes stop_codon:yes gene_type:complete
MNKQQILAKIMLELNSMGLVQSVNIKSQSDLNLFMEQLALGLEESDLLNPAFLSNGFKEIRSGRAGVKDFYPSVPTFIAACTPKFEQWGLSTAQDAYDQASKVANSHFKSKLEPLVYMAGKGHWAALGEGKGFKEFCRRYDDLFQKWARGKIEAEKPPIPIEAPKAKAMTDDEKKDAHNLMQNLIKGIENE